MAQQADRHIYYEQAVQCVESEIDFIDTTVGYGIASSGEFVKITHRGATVDIIELTYNGSPISDKPFLLEVLDTSNIYVGYGSSNYAQVLYHIQNETEVTLVSPEVEHWFTSVEFYNKNKGYLASTEQGFTLSLYTSTDLGASWVNKKESCCTTMVEGIYIIDADSVIAVGGYSPDMYYFYGMVLQSKDKGETWDQIEFDNEGILLNNNLKNISAFNPSKFLLSSINKLFKLEAPYSAFASSVINNSQTEFSIVVNDLSREIQIEFTDQSIGDYTVRILDINGRIIQSDKGSINSKTAQIQLQSNISNGIYLVNLITQNRVQTKPFIIN